MSTTRGYLKVKITAGAKKIGRKNFEIMLRKGKKRKRAMETEWERHSQLGLPKLAEFINFF